MEDAMQQFKTYEETADADPSMVTDQYLDPLHLTLEMPDMSRLEKPAKPPVPQVCIRTDLFKPGMICPK